MAYQISYRQIDLAFPSSWVEKGKGLLYGVLILTVLNLLRLPILYIVGANGSLALFEFFHVQGGFIVFIGITVFIWCYWIIKVLNNRKLTQETIPVS